MRIRARLGLSLGLLIVTVSSGIAAGLFFSQRSMIRQSIEKDQDRMVQALAAVGEQYLLNKNDLLLANYLRVVAKMDGVLFAYIVDTHGRILGHTDTRLLNRNVSAAYSGVRAKAVEKQWTIQVGERVLAEAVIGFSDENIRRTVRAGVRTLMARIFYGASVFMLFGIGAAFMLAGYLTGPLEELARGAEEIGQGNFAFSVPVRSDDELGRLSSRFNEMAAQLGQLDQIKDDFIANVSHDLRSPLASIVMSAQYLLTESHGSLTPNQQQMLGMMISSGERLSAFINNILDAAKIKAGRMEYDFKTHRLPDLIKEVVGTLQSLARSKELSLTLEAPADFPAVKADGEKIQQVVTNLVSNAIKFTPNGGKIAISVTRDGVMARISIADTGHGIPRSEIPKLFQKFVQLKTDRPTGVRMKSTGLGLVIVKEIVNAHGGTVWVESIEDMGSTFHFTIPLAGAGGASE